ncbi:response regulator [Burkholderia seminalis]|uniref:ATP-binding protein n=1 Tax=Burkholderia seminalis TaxID=488731 RepID=UPI001CF4D8C4|nr:ATP-binding protein [Burkholderia seminalis]MCA8300109.1 response regulator [Burkholderia seminalis]
MKAGLFTHHPLWRMLCHVLTMVLLTVSVGTNAETVCWKPVFTEQELRWISNHPIVHIAVEANWHPIEYMRNGTHAGLVASYLHAISKMTGLTFQTVPGTEWGHAYQALASGKVELLPGVWRELVADRIGPGARVSAPYLVGRLTVVTRNDSAMIFELQRLQGRRIAIKGHGAVEYFVRHGGVALDVLAFDTEELALAAVANGEADVALGIDVTILPIVRRQFAGRLYVSGMLADRPVSLAMLTRTDLPILASIIDKSLAAIPVSEAAAITRDSIELGDYGKPTIRSIVRYRAPVVLAIVGALVTLVMLAYAMWKSRAAALRSKHDKAMFVAFVSHEIRTPMQTVLSSLDFLQRAPLPMQQARRVDAAASASQTLLTLLEDILDYSRLEARKVTLLPQTVELESWVRQTVDMVRWRAERKALALTFDVSGPPSLHVVMDAVRVRQIVLNLLVNAINFTPGGLVALTVSYLARHGSSGMLCIEVRDTGIGIAAERVANVFETYWQADRAPQQGVGGSGLGLAICRELVELMRGSISVESTPHVETVFTVQLPVTAASGTTWARPAAPTPAPAGAMLSPDERATPRVLIVDDHEAVRAALQDQCDALGCISVVAGTGDDAMRQLALDRVDMLLLDCNLPDIDGYALTRMIRQEETARKVRHVPIIAISAESGDAHTARCLESGMDGVLGKPLRLETLRQAIATWCPGDAGDAPDRSTVT